MMKAKGGDEPEPVEDYARVLDQLWHETIKRPDLRFLTYLIGMAALVASEEVRRLGRRTTTAALLVLVVFAVGESPSVG